MRILLIGNPNVGKSVFFSRLTGVHIVSSNYPGTTVEFTRGFMYLEGKRVEVVDVPGVYTLEPSSKAEEVACEMLNMGDVVINVVDSTNLERSLNLTLQLLKKGYSLLVALNFWDEAEHTGIKIDIERLEARLGVPCVPTCALTGEGFKELVSRIKDATQSRYTYEEEERWHEIGDILSEVEQVTHRHHTLRERLGDASIRPWTGIPIALCVMFITFEVIRFIGEGLVEAVCIPLFESLWMPLILKLSDFLGKEGLIHDILIGRLYDGRVVLDKSFGILSTGLFIPFGAVLPYVVSFYFILSLLEDSGYLPRLAVLVDTLFHRLGLHGMAIIPMMLSIGCNVPGALSTRIMETKRERFIAATLMAIAVPCMAQIAMVAGLIGRYGTGGFGIFCGTLLFVWIGIGFLLNRFLGGESMEIFLEIPPYRIPYLIGLLKKVWMRIIWFVREALPWVLGGVLIANLLYSLGVIDLLGYIAAPVVSGVFGLPKEASSALVLGFLRKDVAVGMLMPLNLTLPQLLVASVVLTMYFPCVATFATLVRELGVVNMLRSVLIMVVSVLFVGGMLNLGLSTFSIL
jgi:ferrous iron transport protein B